MICLKLRGRVCWIFGNALSILGLMAVPVYLVLILRIKIGRPKKVDAASKQRYMAENTD